MKLGSTYTHKGRPVDSLQLEPPSLDELPQFREEMLQAYRELQAFVTSQPFKTLLDELRGKTESEQEQFVSDVILDADELQRRGVSVPEGIIIQTSEFEALGPDLFVVKTFVRPGINANLTFFPWMFLLETG